MYSPDKSYKVYDQKVWRSDERDALAYGRDYDFTKTFTEQFGDLSRQVPKCSVIIQNCVNSDYTNYCADNHNCYLCMSSHRCENLLFSYRCHDTQDSIDCLNLNHSRLCYETIDSENCYKLYHSQWCNQSSNGMYLRDCTSCSDCLFCSTLVNKQYCILNKQHTKEEYHEIYHSLVAGDATIRHIYHERYKLLLLNIPTLALHNLECDHCYGDFLAHARNVSHALYVQWAKDSTYIYDGNNVITSRDTTNPDDMELCYENSSSINNYNVLFSYTIGWSKNLYYCDFTMNSQDCFGCISLRNKQYCIFNKQYSKEDYELTVAKIISHMIETGEWWEFFHPSLSPFGYNETVAQESFPLTKNEVSVRLYKRSDYTIDPKIPDNAQVIKPSSYSDDERQKLRDDPSIFRHVIICEVSWRPFMIQKSERDFYHKHNLPLPRKHPDVRHAERVALRPPREFHMRVCDHCGAEMLSVYSSSFATKVYCEKCYQKEVYS